MVGDGDVGDAECNLIRECSVFSRKNVKPGLSNTVRSKSWDREVRGCGKCAVAPLNDHSHHCASAWTARRGVCQARERGGAWVLPCCVTDMSLIHHMIPFSVQYGVESLGEILIPSKRCLDVGRQIVGARTMLICVLSAQGSLSVDLIDPFSSHDGVQNDFKE